MIAFCGTQSHYKLRNMSPAFPSAPPVCVSMYIGRQCHCLVDNIVLLNLHEAKCGAPKRPYSSSEVGSHSLACPGWNTTRGKKSLFL